MSGSAELSPSRSDEALFNMDILFPEKEKEKKKRQKSV
jgi:hypothetical protein